MFCSKSLPKVFKLFNVDWRLFVCLFALLIIIFVQYWLEICTWRTVRMIKRSLILRLYCSEGWAPYTKLCTWINLNIRSYQSEKRYCNREIFFIQFTDNWQFSSQFLRSCDKVNVCDEEIPRKKINMKPNFILWIFALHLMIAEGKLRKI